jgi:thymidylate kinase
MDFNVVWQLQEKTSMHHQQILIIEGPDKTGKSEIAHELSRRLNVHYFKARGEKANFRGDGHQFLNELLYADPRQLDLIEQLNLSIVMDRGFPSEFAYSMVFNRATDIPAIARADEEYARLGARLILCTRSSYDGLVDEDRPDLITPENLYKLEQRYRMFFASSKCRSMVLNVDDENLDREMSEILTWLRMWTMFINVV